MPDTRDREGLLAAASILSGLAFPQSDSFNFFGGLAKMIDSPVWDQVREAMKEHYRKVWQAEARVEGRVELLREETLADLAERFGPVPAVVADQVNALTDEPRLRKLRKLALTAPTREAFVAELATEVR